MCRPLALRVLKDGFLTVGSCLTGVWNTMWGRRTSTSVGVPDVGGGFLANMVVPPQNDCCSICHDSFTFPCQANCAHWFCGELFWGSHWWFAAFSFLAACNNSLLSQEFCRRCGLKLKCSLLDVLLWIVLPLCQETAYFGSGNTHRLYRLADAQFVGGPSIFSFLPILNGVGTLRLNECCVMLQITIATMEGGL